MLFTHSQPPANLSFHKLTLLSPVLTASTFPLKLQLTLHATASNVNVSAFQLLSSVDDVHILTVLSWDAEAIYDFESTVGDQATSRTQSLWPSRSRTLVYVDDSGLHHLISTDP